jgi:hypothetical protein
VAAETGFLIDGKVYEVPELDSLDMAERRVMFDLCGVTQEDFVREVDEDEDEYDARVSRMTRHPGFMESLMHIAYQRGNPAVRRDKVQLVIDRTNYMDAIEALPDEKAEDDESPLALTTEPDKPSQSDSVISSDSIGDGSPSDSDGPVRIPERIGTGRLVTSSPESPRTESVA